MDKFEARLSIVIGAKEWDLGFDLTDKGLGGKDLTPAKFEWCLQCLTPQALKFLRDNGKLIES